MAQQPTALGGITVLDCANLTAGPTIGMILADFGAEVIKIELPGAGDGQRKHGAKKNGQGLHWKYLARNKKLITLALNKPEGQTLFLKLVEKLQPDAVIESFRPGTFEKWGIGFERMQELAPGVVLARVSGFGQTGPYSRRPGFGTLAEGMSGFAHLTGQPDGPPTLPPFAMADQIAALYSTIGLLIALHARKWTGGGGQVIDTALLEGIFSFLNTQLLEYDQLRINPGRMGSRVLSSAPRNLYRTSDGRYVALAAAVDSIVERLFGAMQRTDLMTDPRFSTNQARLKNVDALDELVGGWIAQYTQEAILAKLEQVEVAAAPVMDIAQLYADRHLNERGAIVAIDDPDLGALKMHAPLPRLSVTPGRVRHTGRKDLGTENAEIYGERLGLSPAEIADLQSRGVI